MTNFSNQKYVRDPFPNYRPIYRLIILVVKTLVANVSDQLFW